MLSESDKLLISKYGMNPNDPYDNYFRLKQYSPSLVRDVAKLWTLGKKGYDGVTIQMPVSSLLPFIQHKRTQKENLLGRQNETPQQSWSNFKTDISTNGIKQPVILQFGQQDGKVLLVQGNHRVAVASQLGIQNVKVRFSFYRQNSRGVKIASRNWYKTAQNKDDQFDRKIKQSIKQIKFVVNLFKQMSIPLDWIDNNVKFKVKDLDSINALSDSKQIIINKNLINQFFLEDGIHIIVHQLFHWLNRQRENKVYFSDPQQIDAFAMGIAYQIQRGKSIRDVIKIYKPIVQKHFSKSDDFKALFLYLLKRSQHFIKVMK